MGLGLGFRVSPIFKEPSWWVYELLSKLFKEGLYRGLSREVIWVNKGDTRSSDYSPCGLGSKRLRGVTLGLLFMV